MGTKQRKRHFLLLEVLISLGLVSLLLFALMTAWASVEYTKTRLHKKRESYLNEGYLTHRLSHLFANTLPKGAKGKDRVLAPLFYSDYDGSAVIAFDNHTTHNPDFAGDVLSRLYHDRERNELRLVLWPPPACDPNQLHPAWVEVLAKEVEGMELTYFHPSLNEWVSTWDREEKELPAFIRLTLLQKGERKEYSFFLANRPQPIKVQP